MTIALDTLSVVRKLQAAGFSESQAEAVTEVVRDVQDAGLSELATKSDLRAEILAVRTDIRQVEARLDAKIDKLEAKIDKVELRLDAKIDGLRKDMRADNEATKSELVRWMFGTMGFQTVVMIGAAMAIARLFVR